MSSISQDIKLKNAIFMAHNDDRFGDFYRSDADQKLPVMVVLGSTQQTG